MILRSLPLRHGRKALAKPAVRSWKRALATQVHTDYKPYDTTFQDQQFVEGAEGASKSEAIRSLPSRTNSLSTAESDRFAQNYYAFEKQKNATKHIGAAIEPHYQPHTLITNPPAPKDITLELLMASQSHLGHATALWNPANSRYIYGIREGIHIISLDVTASHLRRACAVVRAVTERAGLVLFVGTRKGQDRAVIKAAQLSEGCHLFDRWIPGSITNGPQILGGCRTKVVDRFDREVPGFTEQLENRGSLKPDLVVCLNPLENHTLLHECGLNNIPTIGVIDTDANPTQVTYPIPANDDSLRCIQVIAGVLGRAGQEGQARRRVLVKSGLFNQRQDHRLSRPKSDEATDSAQSGPLPKRDGGVRQIEEEDSSILTTRSLEGPHNGVPENNASFEHELMRIYYQADMSDFEDDAPYERLVELMKSRNDLNDNDRPALTPEVRELLDRIRSARQEAGLDPNVPAIRVEKIDKQDAKFYQRNDAQFLDNELTREEREGLMRRNIERADGMKGIRWAEVLRRRQRAKDGAKDQALDLLVAQKRRDLGETLSEDDKSRLRDPSRQLERRKQPDAITKPQQPRVQPDAITKPQQQRPQPDATTKLKQRRSWPDAITEPQQSRVQPDAITTLQQLRSQRARQVSEPASEEGNTDGAFVEASVEQNDSTPQQQAEQVPEPAGVEGVTDGAFVEAEAEQKKSTEPTPSTDDSNTGKQASEPAGEEGVTDGAFVEADAEAQRTAPVPTSSDSKKGEQLPEPAGEEGITDGAFVEANVEDKRTEPAPSNGDGKKGE